MAPAFVVFGRQETLAGLRAALELNARGFVVWPEQRQRLRPLVERQADAPASVHAPTGALHAVWAPKGGAGASVVAAHLAGALATLSRKAILVDLDLPNADQTSILGADAGTKSVADLLRVADELSSETVRSILWSHPLGFDAVLAPGPRETPAAGEPAIRRVLQTVGGLAEHVVIDLPSGLSPVACAGLKDAATVLLVLTPDLLSLKRARDCLKRLRAEGVLEAGGGELRVVLNQAGGPDISAKEVEAVLGVDSVVRLRADFRIYRAVNRGELSPLACKLLTPLARSLGPGELPAVAVESAPSQVAAPGLDGAKTSRGAPVKAPAGAGNNTRAAARTKAPALAAGNRPAGTVRTSPTPQEPAGLRHHRPDRAPERWPARTRS